ncbi:MAG TPA: bifunctional precorrin-2 dehydrogenase/sirohydrochlorin ferrochelatase [Planctomycetota bacterium]|nr:bifunctional precorrin-2 dehydrogenase/sirohydrochlorin ferrochelatase [Planctomycetota bacterium]
MPRYYPVNLDVRGKRCLVVGGGEVALRKARSLLEAGGAVTVVAPEVHPHLRADDRVEVHERAFRDTDLHGAFVVVVATDDDLTNRTVARDAADFGCLVNVVDCPALSNFIVPATLRRGEFAVCVSTGGASPALARRVRRRLEEAFGEEYADFVDVLGEIRRRVFDKVPEGERRPELFRELTDERWLEVLRRQGKDALRTEMLKFIGE